MNKKNEYNQLISDFLNINTNNIYFYWKGRVALYAILKSFGIKEGDEVILPGFTCVVVPNAIKYLNAKPVYVDIEKDCLCPSFETIKNAITEKTKAIICQNTFGLSFQVDLIADYAKKNNIYTIEDCTHGFGGKYNGKPNGTYCDASFFSTQWNKPFSTGIGGFAIINNNSLKIQIEDINKQLITPTFKDKFILQLLLYAKNKILTRKNYWQLRNIYRILSKHNLIIGSSQGVELESLSIPKEYFKNISDVQLNEGIKNISELKNNIKKRIGNAKKYTDFLISQDKYHVSYEFNENHSFLKYPLLVRDRNLFEQLAQKAKIELGDWFCSPIHPVKENLNLWNVEIKKIPIAFEISNQIVNLPTDIDNIENVILFLKKNINQII